MSILTSKFYQCLYIAFTIEKHTVSVLFFKNVSNNKTYSQVEPNSKVNRRRWSLLRQILETFKVSHLLRVWDTSPNYFPFASTLTTQWPWGSQVFRSGRNFCSLCPALYRNRIQKRKTCQHIPQTEHLWKLINLINTYGLANCLNMGFPKVRFLEIWGSRGDNLKPWP